MLRNSFLLSVCEEIPANTNLEFRQLTYIDFSLDDDTEVFSDELISLRNQLEEAEFKGTNLEKIVFITDKTYRDSIIFFAFIAEYSFKVVLNEEDIQGKVEIEFGFPDMKDDTQVSSQKVEFIYKIKAIHAFIHRNLNDREMSDLKSAIRREFDSIKSQNLNRYLSEVQLNVFSS